MLELQEGPKWIELYPLRFGSSVGRSVSCPSREWASKGRAPLQLVRLTPYYHDDDDDDDRARTRCSLGLPYTGRGSRGYSKLTSGPFSCSFPPYARWCVIRERKTKQFKQTREEAPSIRETGGARRPCSSHHRTCGETRYPPCILCPLIPSVISDESEHALRKQNTHSIFDVLHFTRFAEPRSV